MPVCLFFLSTFYFLLNSDILHSKSHSQYGSFSVPLLFVLCFFAHNSTLLFRGDIIPGQTTTLGPLGKDAYLSLLVQEVLELEARVKSQELEIQTLKAQQESVDNGTASTVNKLMSEYIDIKISFGVIKQEFDKNNKQT